MKVIYENFEIKPDPRLQKDSNLWKADVIVIKHEDKIKMKLFSSQNKYKTEDLARKHSIEFGKEIIDGKHQGLSVSTI